MGQMSFSLLLIVILSALFVALLVMIILIKKENKLLSQQLTETTISLALTGKQFNELQEKHDKMYEFQNSLQVAELTTKLQKPRLNAQNQILNIAMNNPPPGKYSNIQSMIQQGMSIEKIAAVLAISTHEAQQLVNLSKIAQGNGV
jgi:ribosomal protein S11